MRKDLLLNISRLENLVWVRGVAVPMLELNQAGILPGFDVRCFTSYAVDLTILCFADVAQKHNISYDEQHGFIVHMKDAEKKKEERYQADLFSLFLSP